MQHSLSQDYVCVCVCVCVWGGGGGGANIIQVYTLIVSSLDHKEKREGLETKAIYVMFYMEVYVVARDHQCISSTTPAKTRETYCVQCIHLRAAPITEPHAPLMVGIIWKRRKYNLDCREVARGTQSTFSCLCIRH